MCYFLQGLKVSTSSSTMSIDSSVMYQHMTEMTILTIYLVVEFAKHLPGFSDISKDNQIVLLKVFSVMFV